jgi:hypothetical protein
MLAQRPWPDLVDSTGLVVIGLLAFGLPLVGYVLLYLDYRAYLRSLRRALVLVRGYALQLPDWARRDSPPCLTALGLSLPCTREEVLGAYRERVKRMHPDAGGSQRDFANLQRHFEEAMRLTESGSAARC